MKKIISVLILLFVIITGCSCKKDVKVKLDYESMPSSEEYSRYLYNGFSLRSYELNSTDEYDEKLANKDSFLLFIYAESCFGCQLLAPALDAYVDEHDIVIYTLNKTNISDNHELYKNGVNTTPFLVLVDDGKFVYKELVTLNSADDASEHVKWVEKWMSKHVEWGNN